MALTFLDTVVDQQFPESDRFSAGTAASHAACADQACLQDRDAFYAEIIRSLNECMAESGDCEGAGTQSPVEDEPLARREWNRLLDRVLSGRIEDTYNTP